MEELLEKWAELEPARCSFLGGSYCFWLDEDNDWTWADDKCDEPAIIQYAVQQAIVSKIDSLDENKLYGYFWTGYGPDEHGSDLSWWVGVLAVVPSPWKRLSADIEISFTGDCSVSLAYGVLDSYLQFLEWLSKWGNGYEICSNCQGRREFYYDEDDFASECRTCKGTSLVQSEQEEATSEGVAG